MTNKIYTKGGDKGGTDLIGGFRAPKSHQRLEAYGTVDELNAWVAMILAYGCPENEKQTLIKIQHHLFNLGAYLAYDKENAKQKIENLPMVELKDVEFLESEIDRMNEELPPLTNFILPGGNQQASACHLARTVCRRAERRVVHLKKTSEVNSLAIQYLNRLSDYFFVLARYVSHKNNAPEIFWQKDV